jgi:hypothetical protein
VGVKLLHRSEKGRESQSCRRLADSKSNPNRTQKRTQELLLKLGEVRLRKL